jgi:response regulator of citrate/malate metabolism
MKRVLVFEDELSSQEIARRAFQRVGITDIAFAADGEAGLNILDRMEPKPDLILCDIFMPEKDGIEIVSALVERKFAGGLILISSGDPTMLTIAQLLAKNGKIQLLGALFKPLNEQALAKAIEAYETK